MQVKQQKVQELILNGMTTIEEISKKTGAGTVCGGCRPRIIELLGGEAWAYVKIVQIREHHKDVRSYQLYPLKNEIVPSLAGQHIVIEANIDGLWVARSYTLTSIADDRFYEITVKREEFGLFSRWLYTHDKESVVLRISDPQGEYIFDPEMKSPAVCLMAGIGITPAIAFARKLTAKEHQRPLHIDYSVHQAEDAVFRDELASWPTRYPHISVNIRITSQQGRIGSQEILELKNRYPDADFFICGPKPYQTAISKALAEFNVPANRIHIEEFTNAGEPFGATHYERSSGS
jgi:nitric-oxide synthase